MQYLYLLQSGTNPKYKIGYSRKDPSLRLKQLQTGNPEPVSLLDSFPCVDALRMEKELHKAFRHYRLQGEWFWLEGKGKEAFDQCWNRLKQSFLLESER